MWYLFHHLRTHLENLPYRRVPAKEPNFIRSHNVSSNLKVYCMQIDIKLTFGRSIFKFHLRLNINHTLVTIAKASRKKQAQKINQMPFLMGRWKGRFIAEK